MSGRPGVARSASEPAHAYPHLDLREIGNLAPGMLTVLLEKMKGYAREQVAQAWVSRQSFGGGKHRHEGLVVRHDFEGELTVRHHPPKRVPWRHDSWL